MIILDLVDNRWVCLDLNGDIITYHGYPTQRADGTMFLTGYSQFSSCVFKIDPNMIVTQMAPMLKSRNCVLPIFVQDRYLLVNGGLISRDDDNFSMVDCECFDTIENTWT